MGIPKFIATLRRLGIPGAISRGIPGQASEMYIDFPGTIYKAVDLVAETTPPGEPIDKDRFYEVFKAELKASISLFNPAELIYLGQDGVVPYAKILQQRSRRYGKSGKKTYPGHEEPEESGDQVSRDEKKFDYNSITPGTDFMNELMEWLKDWLSSTRDNVPEIIYSGPDQAGEGEHKIFDHLRDNPQSPGVRVIWGLDSDLVLMSLLNVRLRGLYLARGDIDFVVDIDTLRYGIRKMMGGSPTAVSDFVVMVLLAGGNDFIPRIEASNDMLLVINKMIMIYNRLNVPLTVSISELHWPNLRSFLDAISEVERVTLLPTIASQEQKWPSPLLRAGLTGSSIVEGLEGVEGAFNHKIERIVNRELRFDFNAFRKAWYANALGVRGMDQLTLALLSRDPSAVLDPNVDLSQPAKFIRDDIRDIFALKDETLEKQIKLMSIDYLTGVAWILAYFAGGYYAVNEWHYHYFHAPTYTDLALYFPTGSIPGVKVRTGMKVGFSTLFSLPMVIPPQSITVLPVELKPVYKYPDVWDRLPTGFTVDLYGIIPEHMETNVIPQPEVDKIVRTVLSKVKIDPKNVGFFTAGDILVVPPKVPIKRNCPNPPPKKVTHHMKYRNSEPPPRAMAMRRRGPIFPHNNLAERARGILTRNIKTASQQPELPNKRPVKGFAEWLNEDAELDVDPRDINA